MINNQYKKATIREELNLNLNLNWTESSYKMIP